MCFIIQVNVGVVRDLHTGTSALTRVTREGSLLEKK